MKLKKVLIPIILTLASFAQANTVNNIDYNLTNLENDLKKELSCEYECSVYTGLIVKDINYEEKLIKFELPLVSSKLSVLTLPFDVNSFNWKSFSLNDKEIHTIAKKDNGVIISVPKGEHKLEITAGIKNNQVFLIKDPKYFENKTKFNVALQNEGGFFILNIDNNKLVKNINKEEKPQENVNLYGDSLYTVQREIFIEDKWKIRTTVYPLFYSKGVTNINVDLLDGEKILTQNIKVNENKNIELSLDGNTVFWESILEPKTNIILKKNSQNINEIWKVYNKNNWVYSYIGKNPSEINSSNGFNSVKTWVMWPNEEVKLNFSLPEAQEGQVNNVTNLNYVTDFSAKDLSHKLTFDINTTIGGRYEINFEDKNTELINLKINNKEFNNKIKNGTLILDLFVGQNKINLDFKSGQRSFIYSFPKIKFESEVKNTYFSIKNAETFNFFTYGGDIKPAILVLGILIIATLMAFALNKYTTAPLSKISWLLLLVGIAQLSVFAMFFIIFWILSFHYKDQIYDYLNKQDKLTDKNFNLLQVIYCLLTLISLFTIVGVVASGLLSNPNNYIISTLPNESTNKSLTWYNLSWDGFRNIPYLVSFDLGLYRIITLSWSVWLAFSLMNWLSWMWQKYSLTGYWREIKKVPKIKEENNINTNE